MIRFICLFSATLIQFDLFVKMRTRVGLHLKYFRVTIHHILHDKVYFYKP